MAGGPSVIRRSSVPSTVSPEVCMSARRYVPGRPAAREAATLLLTLLLASCSLAHADGEGPARCRLSVPEIFEKVSPAVVYIAATSIDPFRIADRVSHVVGSGFIIEEKGLILTNSHVVFDRQSILVTLDEGTTVPGDLVGADPLFDLALIRIPPPTTGRLPTARLGDADRLRVGEEVVAIGNPLGLDQTLTRGVVSALNRILPETPFSLQEPLIQTDAAINPGNSGGPLLNRCAEVVGVNTAIMPDAQNIGFAIPINLARAVLSDLVTYGHVVRPWLGFHGTIIGAPVRDFVRASLVDGLLVETVEPGSPAAKAGLRGGQIEFSLGGRALLIGGDIVTTANGIDLTSPDNLARFIQDLKVGSRVKLTVFRAGDYRHVEYELPERPLLPSDLPERRTMNPAHQSPRGGQFWRTR